MSTGTFTITAAAAAFIADCEGFDQPSKWPGVFSGITIGVGFDLGFCSEAEFKEAWQRHLSPGHYERLRKTLCFSGGSARQLASALADITIPKPRAMEVFHRVTLPKWCRLAEESMPGLAKVPPHAAGAVVSMLFNRGCAMSGPRQVEKRAIRDYIAAYAGAAKPDAVTLVKHIAAELRSMKRLWPDSLGLRNRRDKEAAFAENDLRKA